MPSRILLKALPAVLVCVSTVFGQVPETVLHHGGEIPFELYDEHLIVVKGTIGPIREVNVVLDTGKSPTAISREIAEQLQLQGHSESFTFSNGAIQVQSVVVSSIEVGPLHLANPKVVVQDFSYFRHKIGVPIGAVAGMDVLGTGNFMIDYWNRKIVFGPSKQPRRSVPFETRTPFLTVEPRIDAQELRLLVDSGTAGLVIYRKHFLKVPRGPFARTKQ